MEKPTALRIERAPRGGFFVTRPPTEYGRIADGPVFACTDIDDALGFIKDELEPEAKVQAAAEADTLMTRASYRPEINSYGDICK